MAGIPDPDRPFNQLYLPLKPNWPPGLWYFLLTDQHMISCHVCSIIMLFERLFFSCCDGWTMHEEAVWCCYPFIGFSKDNIKLQRLLSQHFCVTVHIPTFFLFMTIAVNELRQHLFVAPKSSSEGQDWPRPRDARAKINSRLLPFVFYL